MSLFHNACHEKTGFYIICFTDTIKSVFFLNPKFQASSFYCEFTSCFVLNLKNPDATECSITFGSYMYSVWLDELHTKNET